MRASEAIGLSEPRRHFHLRPLASPRATSEEVGSTVRMATNAIAKIITGPPTTRAIPAVGTSSP